MNLKNWLRDKAMAATIAVANVEKNVFGQNSENLSDKTNHEKKMQQGTLADSLVKGEITQEVRDLRWRTYKILEASKGMTLEFQHMDTDENFHYTVKGAQNNARKTLDKIKLDSADDFILEMVVNNDDLAIGNSESMDIIDAIAKQNTETSGEVDFTPTVNYDKTIDANVKSHGSISSVDLYAHNKSVKPIQVSREFIPKFEIEKYTKKLNIRTITPTEKLLEFYVSKYPETFKQSSQFFISDIKKALKDGVRAVPFLDITEVGFITQNVLGADDFLEYTYKINSFDKIVEFDGHYVIKYKATVIVDGVSIIEQYREEELDQKYNNKELRDDSGYNTI